MSRWKDVRKELNITQEEDLLKVLVPLGYKLQIVPMEKKV